MGYKEAVEDGIPMETRNGFTKGYYPPCHICGASIFSMNYKRGLKYTCPECRNYLAEAKLEGTTLPKKQKKLQEAVKRIQKVADITKYEKAISVVSEKLSTPGWFQSTEEIMVVLELIRRKVKIHHQVRVYSYSVDFVLPEYRVALEIDGPLHQVSSRKKDEEIRDELIVQALGEGYELIRISTDNINTNVTKLMKAIDAILKRRKR